MDNMDFYAKSLAYHTKGRKAILEQTELEETKCSCCGSDPCDCNDDCSCKVNESTDLKNDKNHNGVDDKQENEPKDNTVKKTNKMAKEEFEMSEEKLLDMFEEFAEMFDDLAEMFEEHDMDLLEAFEGSAEELVEDELDEGFGSMSKTKQMIARRRAGRRKKLTPAYKLNKNKFQR